MSRDTYLALEAAEERVEGLKRQMERTAGYLRYWAARARQQTANYDMLAAAMRENAADLEITAEGGVE